MLLQVDNLLSDLLLKGVKSLIEEKKTRAEETQIRFQPPDQKWRREVSGGTQNALNVYLVDLRENRKLRSNERMREVDGKGIAHDTPALRRLDCHYLITAWSPASVTAAIEPTLDEHALLYEVAAVLMRQESLSPRQVYAPDPLPLEFPGGIADMELPMTILPVESFVKYPEFWGTMGEPHPWKPSVYLVVTLPVALEPEVAGRIVTSRVTEYLPPGSTEAADVWVRIAGTVFGAGQPPRPEAKAWVRLETGSGQAVQTTETDEQGRFSFFGLTPGNYQLHARGAVAGGKSKPIMIPAPNGRYDITLA